MKAATVLKPAAGRLHRRVERPPFVSVAPLLLLIRSLRHRPSQINRALLSNYTEGKNTVLSVVLYLRSGLREYGSRAVMVTFGLVVRTSIRRVRRWRSVLLE